MHQLGISEAISNAAGEAFQNEKRQGGLLASKNNITALNIQWPKL